MKSFVSAFFLGAFAYIGAAQAQQAAYVWTGMGTNVPNSSKCPTYKMEIDVTVDGSAVKGQFQQEGRDQRHFEAVADANGAFKTKAQVGGGGSMDVTGSVKDGTVILDGYCKFGGKLTKK
jgi:hypothetical protein